MNPKTIRRSGLRLRLRSAPMPVALLLATAVAWSPATQAETDQTKGYKVPFSLALGKSLYDKHCAECHGTWAEGGDKGPTLIHPYYKADHHDDRSFYRAFTHGTKQHHWNFGDMPAVPELDMKKAPMLIKYVRWLQAENGLR